MYKHKKKILIVTDSLGLPRGVPEVCNYEQTWPCLLRDSGFQIHQVSIGGATVSELYRQLEYHYLFLPDIVIVQSGIVDCAPRALGQFESLFFNKFIVTRKLLKLILPRYNTQLRRQRNITYTPTVQFRSYVESIIRKFNGKDLFWIGIVPASDRYEKTVPGIDKNIKMYNELLKQSLGNYFLPLDEIPREGVMSDSIHLNASGHQYIFEKIKNKVS
jgi:lysophospholipase L1-like esterase